MASPNKQTKRERQILSVADLAYHKDIGRILSAAIVDLTRPFVPDQGRAFGLEAPHYHHLLPRSTGVSADRISFCAHASGTHSETAAHIYRDADFESILEDFHPLRTCTVLRVRPVTFGESGESYLGSSEMPEKSEYVIASKCLQEAYEEATVTGNHEPCGQSLMILTGTLEWVFFTDQAMRWISEQAYDHLIVDLVSLDRKVCGPAMPAHSLFFDNGGKLVTEMVQHSDNIAPGDYILNLQLSPFLKTDAVPSRVLLFNKLLGDSVVDGVE